MVSQIKRSSIFCTAKATCKCFILLEGLESQIANEIKQVFLDLMIHKVMGLKTPLLQVSLPLTSDQSKFKGKFNQGRNKYCSIVAQPHLLKYIVEGQIDSVMIFLICITETIYCLCGGSHCDHIIYFWVVSDFPELIF